MLIIGEYFYDGFGRRVKKVASGKTIHYHYDISGLLICETDGAGNPIRDYVYLNGEPLAVLVYGENAGWYFFINDHLGTPQKLFDSAGKTVWEAGYLPFGEARILIADIENNLRFAGQYFDAETGLHYNWHRYYDPATGRYLTPDPIGLAGGINLYGYVSGNPVGWVDPWGLTAMEWAVPAAMIISQMDSPVPGPADMLGGAVIGVALLIDTLPDNIPALFSDKAGDSQQCTGREPTPSTDPDDFDPWRRAKKNKKTGEIWEKDPARHGGEHYEVYKSKKMYEKGIRNRAVWKDGRIKQRFK